MKEEDLRQHFLVQLNGQYDGEATGETFIDCEEWAFKVVLHSLGLVNAGSCKDTLWATDSKIIVIMQSSPVPSPTRSPGVVPEPLQSIGAHRFLRPINDPEA